MRYVRERLLVAAMVVVGVGLAACGSSGDDRVVTESAPDAVGCEDVSKDGVGVASDELAGSDREASPGAAPTDPRDFIEWMEKNGHFDDVNRGVDPAQMDLPQMALDDEEDLSLRDCPTENDLGVEPAPLTAPTTTTPPER